MRDVNDGEGRLAPLFDRSRLVDAALSDYGFFERIIEAIYSRVVRAGDVVVDGGAHTGLHTLPLAKCVGPSGRVIAVEAAPDTAAKLRSRVQHLRLKQVTIVERALSDTVGRVSFTVVRNATTRSGIVEVTYPFAADVEHIDVERVRLDDLLADVPSWRFGKFDLEGGEYHALLGGRMAIGTHRPLLIFERSFQAADWYGYSPHDFFELFDSVGYSVYDLFGDPIIEAEWSRTRRPWYAIGVSVGSEDESLVETQLPVMLGAFQAALPRDSTGH